MAPPCWDHCGKNYTLSPFQATSFQYICGDSVEFCIICWYQFFKRDSLSDVIIFSLIVSVCWSLISLMLIKWRQGFFIQAAEAIRVNVDWICSLSPNVWLAVTFFVPVESSRKTLKLKIKKCYQLWPKH